MYNLTAQNNHNFFITELGVMVHNMDCKNVKLGEFYKEFGDKIRIEPLYEGDNIRPISFEIEYTIEGMKTKFIEILNQAGG